LIIFFSRNVKGTTSVKAKRYLEQIENIFPEIVASPIRKTVKVEHADKTILTSLQPGIEPDARLRIILKS